jgi:hypothetical protein
VLEAQQRAAREKEVDWSRGPPPQPTRDFRVPPEAVGDVLLLWELCQSFGAAMQVCVESVGSRQGWVQVQLSACIVIHTMSLWPL